MRFPSLFTRRSRCWVHQTVNLQLIRCELASGHRGEWHQCGPYSWQRGAWYTRVAVTKEDQVAAAKQAIINSTSPLKITPGMWQALKDRLGGARWQK